MRQRLNDASISQEIPKKLGERPRRFSLIV
jgi:hypothetical protein